MLAADLIKYFLRKTSTPVGYIIESLADAFVRVGTGRNVKEGLIAFCILDDIRHHCLPIYPLPRLRSFLSTAAAAFCAVISA